MITVFTNFALDIMVKILMPIMDSLVNILTPCVEAIGGVVETISGVLQVGMGIIIGMLGFIMKGIGWLVGCFSWVPGIGGNLGETGDQIQTAGDNMLETAKALIGTGFEQMKHGLETFASSAIRAVQAIVPGGKDGTMYDKNGNLDWNAEVDVDDTGKKKENMVMALSNAYCGLNVNPETGEYNDEITDTENMDFTVVFDAGWPTPVKDAIVDLCDSRQSCFGFLDNGVAAENGNRSAKHAIDKRLTDHNYNDYRVALYEPYTKLYDSFTGTYFWATPMIHVASCFTRTARDKNIWWAAAGLTRGACSGIKDYRYKLAGGYKDMFKEDELNPIMRFNQGGDCIWGNWTTQQTPSALKNIHVVLCLQYIHRVLERNLKQYVYEFNDEYTYSKIKDTVNAFLSDLASERALESFSVNVGATEYQKRNNQCKVDIDLKITGVIEIINVSLNVN